MLSKTQKRDNLQDRGPVRCGDQLPPQKYIKNASTCGTILIDSYWILVEDLMLSKLQERSSRKQVGQKEKKKKKRQSVQNLHPWEGSIKEERFLHPGNPLKRLGDQQWKTGSFRGSEESVAAGLW